MYADDTFFHLSLTGQIGVVVIALVLGGLALWLCRALACRVRSLSAVLLALGVFATFEWLSPQIFYLWYLTQFDGLPLRWIAGYWPRPLAAADVLLFREEPSLSAHGRALLGWALLAMALVTRRRAPDPRAGSLVG